MPDPTRRPLLVLAAVLVAVAGLLLAVPAASGQPTPTATTSPTPTASPSPTPTPTPTKCTGYSWFGGVHWCPADSRGVRSTTYGTGRRVYLTSVAIVSVEPTKVITSQHLPCPNLCAPECCDVGLRLYWPGTHRPRAGDVVRLYGVTTTGSLAPKGYVKTGEVPPCTDPYACCNGFC